MSRTTRYDNGLNHGRDRKPVKAHCWPTTDHPKGFDTREDDHGVYGPYGIRWLKREASKARRRIGTRTVRAEIKNLDSSTE